MFKHSIIFTALLLSGCDGELFSSSLSHAEAKKIIDQNINKECVYSKLDKKEDLYFNTIQRVKDPVTGVISNNTDTGIISVGQSQLHLAQAYALKSKGLVEEVFFRVYQGEKTKQYYVQPNTDNPSYSYQQEKIQSKPGHTFRITSKGRHFLKRDLFDNSLSICVGRKTVDTLFFAKEDANKETVMVEYTVKPHYYLDIVKDQAFITAFKNITVIDADPAIEKIYLTKGKNEYLVEKDPASSTGQ